MGEKNILLVDDSSVMRMFLSTLIRKTLPGITIVEAVNGLDALEKLKDQDFDLVLTDMIMPEMDGVQLIEEIRRGLNKRIPIVIITTKGEEGERERGLSIGADGYLTKPIDGYELKETVLKFLGFGGEHV